MAVKGSATVTLSQYRDTDSVTRYYKLQLSSLSAPDRPTNVKPNETPAGWSKSEPACDITMTLYTVDVTVFSDGTTHVSDVSKSTSYEAAKEAYNKASHAQGTADAAKEFTDNALNNFGYQYKAEIEVGGDPNTYYPVMIFGPGQQDVMREILVKRSFGDKAPEAWNGHPTTHGIGCTCKIKCNFGEWGGADYDWRIHELQEMYGHAFGGCMTDPSGLMFFIFLRGGGAAYTLYSDMAMDGVFPTHFYPTADYGPSIWYNGDVVANRDGRLFYAPQPRTYTDDVIKEIHDRTYIKVATDAYKNADTAQSTADIAQQKAEEATASAALAQQKAESATAAAATAQQKAESATAAAGTAQSAAQSATSDARAAGIAAATAQAAAEAAQGDIDEQQKYFYHDAIGAHVLDAANGNFRTDIKSTGMYVVDTATETPLTEITDDSLIFGVGNVCNGSNNIALGRENESEAGCQFSYLEGNRCKIGNYGTNTSISSHAEGHSTIYGARFSHTEGEATITATDEKPLVMYSHAEGTAQIKGASWCHAEGESIATGNVYNGHLEGESKITDSLSSHSEGRSILVNCDRSHAEGMAKIEYGSIDHAEGKAIITRTKAADYEVPSHAEGTSKIEESWISHAEGSSTITGAKYAHAEGDSTVTGAEYAHAEGNVTEATGEASHVEGYLSKANGKASHAEGTNTIASGENSHASGERTEAVGACQTVLGKFNTADAEKALIVGNGDLLNRSNALTLDWDGNLKAAGDVTCDAAVGTVSLSALNDRVAALSMVIDKVWTKIYPVGSIYISTSAESPADLFGGTWERIQDRFLLASGDTYAAGNTGGSADSVVVSHSHEQTAHSHGFAGGDKVWTTASGSTEPGNQISGSAKYYAATAKKDYAWRTRTTSETPDIKSTGESGVGKNMPPYLAVYVWKRIS